MASTAAGRDEEAKKLFKEKIFWPQRPRVGTRGPKNFLRKNFFAKKNLKKIFLRKKKHKNFFDLLGRRTFVPGVGDEERVRGVSERLALLIAS